MIGRVGEGVRDPWRLRMMLRLDNGQLEVQPGQ